jgi:hypothetical protein
MDIVKFDEILPFLNAEFPEVNEKSIRDIVRHGLGMIGMFQTKGYDIYLNNNHNATYVYLGRVSHTDERRYEIYNKWIRKKFRFMYALRKTPYCGFMYFNLDDQRYSDFLQGKTVQSITLYKVLDEVRLYKSVHCFKIAMENPRKWKIWVEDLDISKAIELQ